MRPRLSFIVGLAAYLVAMRLLPYGLEKVGMSIAPGSTFYPWNFSPLPAVCLFGGACFAERRWAYAVPLGAWALSDLLLWPLRGAEFAFYAGQPLIYLCAGLTIAMGHLLRTRRSALLIGATGLAASVMFFLVTNFAVWAFGTRYPKTMAGLLLCYVEGLPFFRNYAISMAIFSAVLFSMAPRALVSEPVADSGDPAPAPTA